MPFKHRLKNLRHQLLWGTGIPQEVTTIVRDTARPNFERSYVDRGTQRLLAMKYQEHFANGHKCFDFDEVEFRNHSQNGEDGILWYIFSLIGNTNKRCVEICAADGTQCNCANLIINHGWTGLLFDGDANLVKRGQDYFRRHPDTFVYPPKLVHAWITADNVNSLIAANGMTGEIDLLSLDMDGVDYWVWKAIDAISPRVVVAEIQSLWRWEASVTVPYAPDFRAEFLDGFGLYAGASLPAFVKLGEKKDIVWSDLSGTGSMPFLFAMMWARRFFPEYRPNSAFHILLTHGLMMNFSRW